MATEQEKISTQKRRQQNKGRLILVSPLVPLAASQTSVNQYAATILQQCNQIEQKCGNKDPHLINPLENEDFLKKEEMEENYPFRSDSITSDTNRLSDSLSEASDNLTGPSTIPIVTSSHVQRRHSPPSDTLRNNRQVSLIENPSSTPPPKTQELSDDTDDIVEILQSDGTKVRVDNIFNKINSINSNDQTTALLYNPVMYSPQAPLLSKKCQTSKSVNETDSSQTMLFESFKKRLHYFVWKQLSKKVFRFFFGCSIFALPILIACYLIHPSFSSYKMSAPLRRLQGPDIDGTIRGQDILDNLLTNPLNYFIFLWLIIAVPLGFGFCCWLCAQRNYQKVTAVSP